MADIIDDTRTLGVDLPSTAEPSKLPIIIGILLAVTVAGVAIARVPK